MAPREPNNTKQFHDNRACGDSSLQSATNVRSCTQAHSLADTVTAGTGPYRFAQPHSRPMSSAVRADLNMRSIFKQRRRAITLPTGLPPLRWPASAPCTFPRPSGHSPVDCQLRYKNAQQ
eukprot:GHVU01015694.1.p1 GENE.GHVU01015694.1~~GHVU01015694.1.p1  ORF type:complete len:120 (+),score=1.10 GHVU01015694.1:1011-1370(+)